jgi:hypothetical protein
MTGSVVGFAKDVGLISISDRIKLNCLKATELFVRPLANREEAM